MHLTKMFVILSALIAGSLTSAEVDPTPQSDAEILVQLGFASYATFKSPSGEVDYFFSANEAGWTSARDDCRRNLAPDGHLLSIETEEEWDFTRKELEKNKSTMYWTSGAYDTRSDNFLWEDGTQLGDWAPWISDLPDKLHPFLRLTVVLEEGKWEWAVQQKTKPLMYICEVPMPSNK